MTFIFNAPNYEETRNSMDISHRIMSRNKENERKIALIKFSSLNLRHKKATLPGHEMPLYEIFDVVCNPHRACMVLLRFVHFFPAGYISSKMDKSKTVGLYGLEHSRDQTQVCAP